MPHSFLTSYLGINAASYDLSKENDT